MAKVQGRFHAGKELQEPEPFTKSHLIFPSGESLSTCWFGPAYRQQMSDIAVRDRKLTLP